MKERPIIFSADMVKAILYGKKTITRRVVKTQPSGECTEIATSACFGHVEYRSTSEDRQTQSILAKIKCPYGKVGDRLWVREAYTVAGWNCDDGSIYIKYLADGHEQYFDNETDEMECAIDSLVTSVCKELDKRKVPMLNDEAYDCSLDENKPRNRSPMFMPRFASRLLLEITDIRVERLNDISEADAVKEGVSICENMNGVDGQNGYVVRNTDYDKAGLCHSTAQKAFYQYWDSLNVKKGYPWSSNPWVWVIEFKKVENDEPSD